MSHTPGPWVLFNLNGIPSIEDTAGYMLAEVFQPYPEPEDREEAFANARLIAAAPELLEAAKRVLGYAAADSKWADDLEAAINKAEAKS
jgi:hypothetical protein